VTKSSDLTGLAARTYCGDTPPVRDYALWDDCVIEEAAQRLETPAAAIYDLEEATIAAREIENRVESVIERLEDNCEDSYYIEMNRIEFDVHKLAMHLERALDLLKQNEIDFRLPDLLRKGCKRSGLIANPYSQHKDQVIAR
jgi:hypothetical protein